VVLERAKTGKEAHGEFESEHPSYCGAQDMFYVGNLKGVGRVYQQTFIDSYAKVACVKLYGRRTPIMLGGGNIAYGNKRTQARLAGFVSSRLIIRGQIRASISSLHGPQLRTYRCTALAYAKDQLRCFEPV